MNAFETVAKAILERTEPHHHEDCESFEVGNIFVKVMRLATGQQLVTHAHTYNHAHILGKGIIEVELNGVKRVYEAPSVIEIKAGFHHGMTAIEESIAFCVHDLNQVGAWFPYRGQ